jgi:hypothetical protein
MIAMRKRGVPSCKEDPGRCRERRGEGSYDRPGGPWLSARVLGGQTFAWWLGFAHRSMIDATASRAPVVHGQSHSPADREQGGAVKGACLP